ncbi:MAG: GNAT family N-acetyltransferase [Pseudomonadota bacterium]
MSAALTLAMGDHAERLLGLIAAYHEEEGLSLSAEARKAAVMPLLQGSPHGAIYLIGPAKAPIGYVALSFGWSIEFGGMDGFVDELFIRPGVRGRGIATEVLQALPRALAGAGLKALHLEVATANETAQRLYGRSGFQMRENYHLMTRRF